MGNLLSGKHESTREVLENIEKELVLLDRTKLNTQSSQRQLIGFLLIGALVLYLIIIVASYIYFFPRTLSDAVINLWPLVLFPVIVFTLKKFTQSYFTYSIGRTDERIADLKEQRRSILDNVKDSETFTVATELLERFDPETRKRKTEKERLLHEDEERKRVMELRRQDREMANDLRRRPKPTLATAPPAPQPIASTPKIPQQAQMTLPTPQQMLMLRQQAMTPRLTNAPMLPATRTPVDKVVDYLLGDGPSNRYALICTQCHSHNGMALRNEFEYIAFRCAYCHKFNPARKQRTNVNVTDMTGSAMNLARQGSLCSVTDASNPDGTQNRSASMQDIRRSTIKSQPSNDDEGTINDDHTPTSSRSASPSEELLTTEVSTEEETQVEDPVQRQATPPFIDHVGGRASPEE